MLSKEAIAKRIYLATSPIPVKIEFYGRYTFQEFWLWDWTDVKPSGKGFTNSVLTISRHILETQEGMRSV